MRKTIVIVLVVLFAVIVPMATIAAWARVTVLNADRFSQTLAPLATDDAMQQYLSDQISGLVMRQAAAQGMPLLANGPTARLIRSTVDAAVESSYFPIAWQTMLRAAHGEVEALLNNDLDTADGVPDGRITIDVAPLIEQIDAELVKGGVNLDLTNRLTPTDRQITLLRAQTIEQVQWFTKVLDTLGILLPLVAIAIAAATIVLARDRIRAGRWLAIACAFGVVLLLATDIIGRRLYLDSIGNALPRDIAAVVFDTILRSLFRTSLIALAGSVVGVIGLTVLDKRSGSRAIS